MPKCSMCRLEKPDSAEFWPQVNGKKSGSRCKKCHSITSGISRRKNRAVTNAGNAAWKLRNKEKNAAINKAWSDANREKVRAAGLAWAKDNPDRHNAKYARRRSAKLKRTPTWLTNEDHSLIEAKYAMAKWLGEVVGIPYHVDHIVPLQGKLVSGLHTPDNLAVVRATDNLRKHNKYEVA